MITSTALFLGVAIDAALGEPSNRWHPLVAFGHYAQWIEKTFNLDKDRPDQQQSTPESKSHHHQQRCRGILAWSLTVLPPVVLITLISSLLNTFDLFISALCLWFAIGLKSLMQHAIAIEKPLIANDINTARQALSWIVSRDTKNLNSRQICQATIESVLENGNDAVFAALFWFTIAGVPGVILYRLANTLDAMWGYRNPRYNHFGWAAARIDDILNFIPARLTAYSFMICGETKPAWQAYKQQSATWYSPNAGPVMATGAGALSVQLGGDANYHGQTKSRPNLGFGKPPVAIDIRRARYLILRSTVLWLVLIMAFEWIT